jgi:hypothetical protein
VWMRRSRSQTPRRAAGARRCSRQPRRAGQQRLAAVSDDPHSGEPAGTGVLGDAAGGLPGHGVRGRGRAAAPALVRTFVDIAVIARQITAAVNFEDELRQRVHGPAHGT